MDAKTLNPKHSLAEYTRLLTCPRVGDDTWGYRVDTHQVSSQAFFLMEKNHASMQKR
jgi:hypothetical protein